MTVILARLKPPVNTPKSPPGGGYPVKRATNAQHNADNAAQTQHSAVTVAAVCPTKPAKICANFQKSTFFTFLAHTRVSGCNFGGGSV